MIKKIFMSYRNTGIRVLLFISVLFIINAAGSITARGIFIDSLEINKDVYTTWDIFQNPKVAY